MGNWENITGGNGEKDAGAACRLLEQWETHGTPSQQMVELEEKGQRRAVSIYNWLHLRSVLSPRLERALDSSGTCIAHIAMTGACVKYNMENNNSQASLLLGAVLGAQSSAGSQLLEEPELPLSKVL